jgi:hypothetical protein
MSYICVTCGTGYPTSSEPPRNCPICQDERQYVGSLGQRWVSLDELQRTHRNVFFEEGDSVPCCCKRKTAVFFGTASA